MGNYNNFTNGLNNLNQTYFKEDNLNNSYYTKSNYSLKEYQEKSFNKNIISKLRDKHPFLKQFFPKFTKKDTIDKKILRAFRRFLIEEDKKKELNLENTDKIFWNIFINKNLLPPMIFHEKNENNENNYNLPNESSIVQFKSFGNNYCKWLFSKRGAIDLFKCFIIKNGECLYESFIKDYKIKEDDPILSQLNYYIYEMPLLYLNISQMPPINPSCSEELFDNILGPDYNDYNLNLANDLFSSIINKEEKNRKINRKRNYIRANNSSDYSNNEVAPSYYEFNSSSGNEKEE